MEKVEEDLARSKNLREKQAKEFSRQLEDLKIKHEKEVCWIFLDVKYLLLNCFLILHIRESTDILFSWAFFLQEKLTSEPIKYK